MDFDVAQKRYLSSLRQFCQEIYDLAPHIRPVAANRDISQVITSLTMTACLRRIHASNILLSTRLGPVIQSDGDVQKRVLYETLFVSSSHKSVVNIMFCMLVDERTSPSCRWLCSSIIRQMCGGKVPLVFEHNFGGDFTYYEKQVLCYFLPILLHLESVPQSRMLRRNFCNICSWIEYPMDELRSISIPALSSFFRARFQIVGHFTKLHIGIFEHIVNNLLKNVGGVSSSRQNGPGRPTQPVAVVKEPDGSDARDFFTVLNSLPGQNGFRNEHISNMHIFSVLRVWLSTLYFREKNYSQALQDILLSYCFRLLDQVSMPRLNSIFRLSFDDKRLYDDFLESVVSEVVLNLDILCRRNPAIVTDIFPRVKKFGIDKFNRHIPRSQSRHGALTFLGLLEFCFNHNESVIFDVEPVFRSFFCDYLGRECTNSVLAYKTLLFCSRYKRKLLTHTNMLSQYFPSLLKLLAWHPHAVASHFLEILPALISSESCFELLHALLDLPLQCAAMECAFKANVHSYSDIEAASKADGKYLNSSEASSATSFFRLMLRDSAYIDAGSTRKYPLCGKLKKCANEFCKSRPVTPRVFQLCMFVPILLETYFDVMLTHAPEKYICEMISLIFQRFSCLFGPKGFKGRVRRVMLQRCLASFQRYPWFLRPLTQQVVTILSRPLHFQRQELQLHLCWIIGEYADIPSTGSQNFSELFQSLELVAYEQVAQLKSASAALLDGKQAHVKLMGNSSVNLFRIRILHVLVGSLAKLGTKCTDFQPRTQLCLAKVVKLKPIVHYSVILQSYQLANLSKCSSVAYLLLDRMNTRTSGLKN